MLRNKHGLISGFLKIYNMAKIQIVGVEVQDNPAMFSDPLKFQITFDCVENLEDDLEWKIIYVGSSKDEQYDQTLDSVLVGPVPSGRHKFVFTADPPKPDLIPKEEIVGVTVCIITCSYHSREFVRIGYFVNNEYQEAELREEPPQEPDLAKLHRNILHSAPRVTRFKINWGDETQDENQQVQQEEGMQQDQQTGIPDPDEDSTIRGFKNEVDASGDAAFGAGPAEKPKKKKKGKGAPKVFLDEMDFNESTDEERDLGEEDSESDDSFVDMAEDSVPPPTVRLATDSNSFPVPYYDHQDSMDYE